MMNMVEEILALIRKLRDHNNHVYTLKILLWCPNKN